MKTNGTFSGVDVTDITNQPPLSRSNRLISNETSYVSPRVSRTVVNNLRCTTAIN